MRHRLITAFSIVFIFIFIFFAFDIPYHFSKYFLMYDCILYDGNLYYFTEKIPDLKVNFSEKVPVNLVEGESFVYSEHIEYAHTYIGDSETMYLYFDSATFTSDKTIAIPTYGEE